MTEARVVPFAPVHLPGLTRLVRGAAIVAPPYWVLTEEQVARVIRTPDAVWVLHYPELAGQPPARTLCALDGHDVLAAAGVTLTREAGVLHWIVGEDADAIAALHDQISAEARAVGCPTISTGRWAFGVGTFGLWSAYPAVEVLRACGWAVTGQWHVYTVKLEAVPPAPIFPRGYTVGWHMNRAAGEWTARAFFGNDEIGTCEVWTMPELFEDHPLYGYWVNIELVEVTIPEQRRRGLARWMLAEQTRFHQRRGAGAAIASVLIDNFPARRLASAIGGSLAGSTFDMRITW